MPRAATPPRTPMKNQRLLLIPLMAALAAGCSSEKVLQPAMEVTIGQQLIDLKKARDAGALNAREYEDQKQRLIDNLR